MATASPSKVILRTDTPEAPCASRSTIVQQNLKNQRPNAKEY